MSNLFIHKTVLLHQNRAWLNGEQLFSVEACEPMGVYLKLLYKHLNLTYGKFYKMDRLSKLGFLGAEMLLNNIQLANYKTDETAIIFANSAASLETDHKFQDTINDIPSPAVFVYTLANIVIGEICIKHNIKGETAFFVQETFDADFLINYTKIVFSNTQIKQCILAWVEADTDGSYKCVMTLIKRLNNNIELNQINLNNIINK